MSEEFGTHQRYEEVHRFVNDLKQEHMDKYM